MARPSLPLTRHLCGIGIELGPFFQPFPLDMPGVLVRYVDRFTPAENAARFTELSDQEFQVPDIVTNFDRERLRCLRDASQDFVIASHVLEHLAEPLGMLDDIHRVLRPGGALMIVLPDRRRNANDVAREPTSVAHLAAEYRAGVTEVSDEHIQEYVAALTPPLDVPGRLTSPEEHRLRSIHVHVWSDDEFLEVLDHCVANLAHTWDFIDGCATDDPALEGWEFAYLLRRGRVPKSVSRFRAGLEEWRKRRDAVAARSAAAEATLAEFRESRSWRVTRPLRAISSSISRLRPKH
jgi:SAM-dependent methyltransferase